MHAVEAPKIESKCVDEHVHYRFGEDWSAQDKRFYVVACRWWPNARSTNLDWDKYEKHTTHDFSNVTCPACLEAVIKIGDEASKRYAALERVAGDATSEVACSYCLPKTQTSS